MKQIKQSASAVPFGTSLMAVVVEKDRQRKYLPASARQVEAAIVSRPGDLPEGRLPENSRDFRPQLYGMPNYSDLFTNRQLTTLTTFSDLVEDARLKVQEHSGSDEYADAIATYLGLCASKMAVFHTSLSRWRSDADKTAPAFGRQAIAMVWDFAEPMPFAGAGGDWTGVVDGAARTLEASNPVAAGHVVQAPAQSVQFRPTMVVSTDPPYYDNIAYADLSDYFYVWLRRTLRAVYPQLLSTMLTPKTEELVANPYRHGDKDSAKDFFESGFRQVFLHARADASEDYPLAVFYAFKQSEIDDDGQTSSGWETLLEGMISGGWAITSTWPMRTEGSTRLIARDTNALASSIVLSLRPRPEDAPTIDRRGFIVALERDLPPALRSLQQGQIAPVDLPQAAIGPGMAVFSRYAAVLESDGSKMGVRSALARINEILDRVLNEQEGDFDSVSRFAIAWYRQHSYLVGKFGDADNLARALNTSVDVMVRDGVVTSRAGNVQLLAASQLTADYEVLTDPHISTWEALHNLIRTLENEGILPAGEFLREALRRPDNAVDPDLVKELAHLLFRIAETNGWTKDALSFNNLVTSWPEIFDAAKAPTSEPRVQGSFDFSEEDD